MWHQRIRTHSRAHSSIGPFTLLAGCTVPELPPLYSLIVEWLLEQLCIQTQPSMPQAGTVALRSTGTDHWQESFSSRVFKVTLPKCSMQLLECPSIFATRTHYLAMLGTRVALVILRENVGITLTHQSIAKARVALRCLKSPHL